MRATLTVVLCLAAFSVAQAQEALPRDEALKAALSLCRDLPKMLSTPIPTDPDVKRPVGVLADNRGLLVLPETKLSPDVLAKVGPEAVSIGQLWLLKLVPLVGGQAAAADKLQQVTVTGNDNDLTVALSALGVRKTTEGGLELLVYGKGKEPLLKAPLTESSCQQENPIEVTAEPQGDGGLIRLNVLGRYTASVPVAFSE